MMRSIGGLAASLTVVLWITVAVAAFAAFAFFNRAAVVGDMIDFDIRPAASARRSTCSNGRTTPTASCGVAFAR